MTYYLTAFGLFAQIERFDNETRGQVFVKIIKRQYRLHWLRAAKVV
jgi:hypothetical protein